jgi:hypothetical protein
MQINRAAAHKEEASFENGEEKKGNAGSRQPGGAKMRPVCLTKQANAANLNPGRKQNAENHSTAPSQEPHAALKEFFRHFEHSEARPRNEAPRKHSSDQNKTIVRWKQFQTENKNASDASEISRRTRQEGTTLRKRMYHTCI